MDMKTPTIIVRLGGLYLIVSCTIGLMQMSRMQPMLNSLMGPQLSQLQDMKL